MIRSFADPGAEDVSNGVASRRARAVWPVAWRKLDQLNQARGLAELKAPPGNRLERLRGDRAGEFSLRINRQYRICFRWEDGHAEEVRIVDYH